MHSIPALDAIIPLLEDLSLQQLLEIKKKVDFLVKDKFSDHSSINDISSSINYDVEDIIVVSPVKTIIRKEEEFFIVTKVKKIGELQNQFKEINEKNKSLEDVIELVEGWMIDESGYDEEVYPQIEAALHQNS